MNAAQLIMPLKAPRTETRAVSLVDIPSRADAEAELERLRKTHGPDLARHRIRKARPGPSGTFTLCYYVTHTEDAPVFNYHAEALR